MLDFISTELAWKTGSHIQRAPLIESDVLESTADLKATSEGEKERRGRSDGRDALEPTSLERLTAN